MSQSLTYHSKHCMSGRAAFDGRSQGNCSCLHIPLTTKVLFLQASPPSPHLKEHLVPISTVWPLPPVPPSLSPTLPAGMLCSPTAKVAAAGPPPSTPAAQLQLLSTSRTTGWRLLHVHPSTLPGCPPRSLANLAARLSPGSPQKCGGPLQGLAMCLHYPNSLQAQQRSSIPPPLLSHPAGSQVG